MRGDSMERHHEFTISVPGDGTYAIELLEGVELEQRDGTTIGRWPAFGPERRRCCVQGRPGDPSGYRVS